MKKYLKIIVLLLMGVNCYAQQFYLKENFEDGSIPNSWSQLYVSQNEPWKYRKGIGFGSIPPTTAYEGNYNVSFYKNTLLTTKTKLFTPKIDLTKAVKPELRFYYANYYYEDEFGAGNAKLSVYYRSELYNTGWVKLKDYDEPHDGWTYAAIVIPDAAHLADIQLAIEGRIEGEFHHGVCIDNIAIVETAVIPKYINSITSIQTSSDLIPTGSENNPVLCLKLSVGGNNGDLLLNKLTITSLLNSSEVVPENGIKLFVTLDNRFNETVQIGSAATFTANKAVFLNTGYNIPIGDSYLWVCFDIPVDPNHLLKGKKIDAEILSNDMTINNTTYNSTDINPTGYRNLGESLFYDDFENNSIWSFTGEFEQNSPKGFGGLFGNPDPTYARSGHNVIGVDLTGKGSFKGDYEKNIGSRSYTAKTDTLFNAKYYRNLNLSFYRWLNVYFTDSAYIDISLNGGQTYKNIWRNSSSIIDNIWTYKQINLSNIADRQDSIVFRIALGPTGSYYPYSGWNIDNFAITGTFIEKDAGVAALLSPNKGCGNGSSAQVKVLIKNYGFNVLTGKIPLGYSINGGTTWVMDTLNTTISRDELVDFTFSHNIDLSQPGKYNFTLKTFLDGDEDSRNNQFDTTIYISPLYSLPYAENFENGDGYWRSLGNNQTFELGSPDDGILNSAWSGENCWKTNLSGNYPNNDLAWIESPCFNFTGIEKPVFECMLWADAEKDNDGLALYYSLNEGITWQLVPTQGLYNWNWYNKSSISALGNAGWDSLNTGWFKVRQLLPASVVNQSGVKLKLQFASNGSVTDAGFGIDDIRVYNAPVDAGVVAFASPVTSCYLSDSQQVVATIKNFGIRDIKPTDTIFTTLIFQDQKVTVDTFYTTTNIAVNSTFNHTFSGYYDMFNKGAYKLMAYTHLSGDTAFYYAGIYNDTLTEIKNVLGEPLFDLGPDIGTLQPDTVVLNAGLSVEDSTQFNYQWHIEDSTQRTFHIEDFSPGITEGTFYVTITNKSNGCQASDSITVIKSVYDRGIVGLNGLNNGCINSLLPNINVDIKNYATLDSILIGDSIAIGYQVNQLPEHIEYVTLTDTLFPGDTLKSVSFTVQPQLNIAGVYEFKAFTKTRADLNYRNDTVYTQLKVYPLPTVDIGPDTIFALSPNGHVFDAGPDRNYYKWLNQAPGTSQTFTVSSNLSAKYYVEVQDTNLCGTASDTVMIISDNWVLDSIVTPVSSCSLSNSEQITIKVSNNSSNVYMPGYQIKARINVDGISLQDTIILTSGLAANAHTYFTFSPVFNFMLPKSYTIKSQLYPTHDIDRNDDKISKSLTVWGIYPVDLGEDTIITKQADTIALDAGTGFTTYLWSNGSSNRYLNIPSTSSAQYFVTVTSEHGCSNSKDSVRIMANDLSVTEIVTPESKCKLVGSNRIRINVINNGTDNIPVSENIDFFYRFNNGNWVKKPYITTNVIAPGELASIILYEDISFESDSVYNMQIYSKWDQDLFNENDTASKSIYQYESPIVDLGYDVYTNQADTVIFDAGAGYTTYTWNDGSKLQTYNVSANYTSDYSVTVTNSNGCYDADSVKIYTYDIVMSITSGAENHCETSDSIPVKAKISINGLDKLAVGTPLQAHYEVGATQFTESFLLDTILDAGHPYMYSFDHVLAIADTGNYTMSAWVSMNNEVDSSNNSFEANFRVGPYLVSLGPDIKTYEEEITLDAGPGFATYLWSTGDIGQQLEIDSSGTYVVNVTDINGCFSSDSVKVFFAQPGYAIDQISGFNDSCVRTQPSSVSFILANHGNDTVYADDQISISYKIEELAEVTENYTFIQDFVPDDVVNIVFTTPIDIQETGDYTIKVSTKIREQELELDTTVHTWGLPQPDLGQDISTTQDAVTLTPGAGFASYLWNTDEDTPTINVTKEGQYWVEVTNQHGCKNSDTIMVNFIPTSLAITAFNKPLTACGKMDEEVVGVKIANAGQKVIPKGSVISIEYRVPTVNAVLENVELLKDMKNGDALTYNFIKTLNLSGVGNHSIAFYLGLDGTPYDTATYQMTIFALPEFDFGSDTIKVEDYPYILEAPVENVDYLWGTGEDTREIKVSDDGEYILKVTDANNCQFSDTVYVTLLNGIIQNMGDVLTIYPNPANNKVFLKWQQTQRWVEIRITNMNGQLIYKESQTENKMSLDISTWPQGVYFIQLNDGILQGVVKLIKQ
jgi:hypothetical protein